jgi:hypothetical protein
LHHRPHFTELATEAFLQRVGGGGNRFIDGDLVDELLSV